ncbi:hypothetical protein P879_10661 [Paragonimus westermani]|uniref:J domain-containing protein n=1 Tax=Paragonimus westermani TaxID=34504 RepID=A0A8T0D6X9_9TREM|nr:hypothetical protein P879_10661 [Paragonimus westermani]
MQFFRHTNSLASGFTRWWPAFNYSQTLVHRWQHHLLLDLWDKDDPYQVLGVDVNATVEEIRSAYYAQSKLLHPDRLHIVQTDKPISAEAFHRLSAAYSLLSDPNSRRTYDLQQTIQRRIRTNSTTVSLFTSIISLHVYAASRSGKAISTSRFVKSLC